MILRRAQDRRTLIVEAIALLMIVFVLWTPFSWASLFFAPILGGLSFVCCIINHNNKHYPIFKSRILNQLNDIVVSLCIGSPATRLHLVHQYNHHSHFRDNHDWSRYTLAGDTQGIARILKYLALATREMVIHRGTLIFPRRFKRELIEQRITLAIFVGMALMVNWQSLIFVIAPSWLIGLYGVLTANFVNHDRCELADDWRHSRNFQSNLENWIFFNNGYHSAHHLRPEAHWSELKQLHALKIAPRTDASTNEDSYFRYFVSTYLRQQRDYSPQLTLLESKELKI